MSHDAVPVRRCVLYARLSVTKEESVSIARQLGATRKYAEGRGWQVAGEFTDDGVSATANRPEERKGWNALLAADFDAVVIWKVDRLARSVLDFLHVDALLRERGAGLVAVEDPIDMTSPMGRAFATILAVFGEMEAAAISARVRAARAHLVSDGRWPGGGIPYGYMPAANPDGPGRILVKDPGRIGWLASAAAMALEGSAVSAIATWLTGQRAPVPRARTSGDAAWSRQTVRGLLGNPVLAGMTPRNPGRAKSAKRADPFAVLRDEYGSPVIRESLALISYADFERLQRHLDAGDTPQGRPLSERQRTSALLKGVAVCDHCDAPMSRGTNQKKAILYCPRCRQAIGRERLDPCIERRLLGARGRLPMASSTVRDCWAAAGSDDLARRAILLTQLSSLRIRRGVVGRFDQGRVLIEWKEAS
jgi:DNA invertase Pin-like site-specific DNA recombinase